MQSAGLVAIALLGGALLVVILGGMIVLGFFMWNAKKVAAAHALELQSQLERQKKFMGDWAADATKILEGTKKDTTAAFVSIDLTVAKFITDSAKSNESVYAEMKAVAESFKASLSGSRTETRTANAEFVKKLEATLKLQHDEMKTITASINGEGLQAASARAVAACLKIEKITALLHNLLLTHSEREESPTGLGAEEYAPESAGTIYDVGPTARQDALFDREEAEETHTD